MEQKIRGLLAYLFSWIGGLIILLGFKDNSKETNFNACQSITLGVTYIAIKIVLGIIVGIITGIVIGLNGTLGFISVLSGIFGLIGWALNIGFLVVSIIGMIKAYQETEFNIPLIGDLTKKIFKNKLA